MSDKDLESKENLNNVLTTNLNLILRVEVLERILLSKGLVSPEEFYSITEKTSKELAEKFENLVKLENKG